MRKLLFLLCLTLGLTACATAVPDAGGSKRIALTFDDVPRNAGAFMTPDERTTLLIDSLNRMGVEQAAFFINPGSIAESNGGAERIARYVAAGHVLANHTNSHPHLSELTAEAFLADIDKAAEWLNRQPANRPWMRYPFLDEGGTDKAKVAAVRAGLAARGLQNGVVTIDASDWGYDDMATQAKAAGKTLDMAALRDLWVESHVEAAEYYDSLARRALGRSPAHNLLLHEADVTALYVADLVRALKAKGWTIITADDAFADPLAKMLPDVPSTQGTITEMVAWERGIPEPRWYPRNNQRLAAEEFNRRVLVTAPSGAEPARTVNGQELGPPEEFATRGPATVCMRELVVRLQAGQSAQLSYIGIHSGTVRLFLEDGRYVDLTDGEIFRDQRRPGQGPAQRRDDMRIYLISDSGPDVRYQLEGTGRQTDDYAPPRVMASGPALAGNRADDRMFGVISFASPDSVECDRRYEYGFGVLLDSEPFDIRQGQGGTSEEN